MKFPSGVTNKYLYFVAVDATDLKTRKTGLSGFTVYRSRNGGAAVAFTTPTISETDTTNMPGVYELLLDEDMTIDAGDDTQEVCLHITQAAMAPVTRVFELYRPKITIGETVTAAGGAGNANVAQLNASTLAAQKFQQFYSAIAGGTSDSGTTTTMVDAARTEADTDYFKGSVILFTSGTLTGQSRIITAFDPATDTITFTPATTVAVGTQTYLIFPAQVDVEEWKGAALATPAVAGVPAVETIDISAAGQTDIRAAAGLAAANLDTQLAAIVGYIDAEVAAILAAVDTEIAAIKAVTDALVAVGSDPSGAPASTDTILKKIERLHQALTNKVTVSATAITFHTSADVALWAKALSDDGTTYTEAKGV